MRSLSRVCLLMTSWTVAYPILLSMGFSGQEYWSGLPFPSPGDLPNPGMESGSPALQEDIYLLSHQRSPRLPVTILISAKGVMYKINAFGMWYFAANYGVNSSVLKTNKKSVLYICVSFSVLHVGLSLTSF